MGIVDKIEKTDLFKFSTMGHYESPRTNSIVWYFDYKLIDTEYMLRVWASESGEWQECRFLKPPLQGGVYVIREKIEDVLDNVPEHIAEELIFHLDLFDK